MLSDNRLFQYLILFSVSILICCCTTLTKTENNQQFEFRWSLLAIDVNNNPLALSDQSYIFFSDGKEYYANYNNYSNSLNIYDLYSQEFVRRVEFFNSGPNKVQGLKEYAVWNDTIILKTIDLIYLIDFAGEILKKIDLIQVCPEIEGKYCCKGPGGMRMTNMRRTLHFHEDSKTIVVRTYNKENGYENIYKNPIFIMYNISSKQGTPLYVDFPEELNSHFFGDLEYPNIITKGDSIIYNFPFKSTIYIYNKSTGNVICRDFETKHNPSLVKGASLGQQRNPQLNLAFYRGSNFHQIDFDPYRDIYYMLYSEASVEGEPRQRHLVVFDNKIEKIGEIRIPTGLSPNFAISKQGLLFRNVHEDSFDTLTLHVLNVEVEKK